MNGVDLQSIFSGQDNVSLAQIDLAISTLDSEINQCTLELQNELQSSIPYCMEAVESALRGKEACFEILRQCLKVFNEESILEDFYAAKERLNSKQSSLKDAETVLDSLNLLDTLCGTIDRIETATLQCSKTGLYALIQADLEHLSSMLGSNAVQSMLHQLPLFGSVEKFIATRSHQIRRIAADDLRKAISTNISSPTECVLHLKAKIDGENTLSNVISASLELEGWATNLLKPALKPLYASIIVPWLKEKRFDLRIDTAKLPHELFIGYFPADTAQQKRLDAVLDVLGMVFSTLVAFCNLEEAKKPRFFELLGDWFYPTLVQTLVENIVDPSFGVSDDALLTHYLSLCKQWEATWCPVLKQNALLSNSVASVPQRLFELNRLAFYAKVQAKCKQHVPLYSKDRDVAAYFDAHTVMPAELLPPRDSLNEFLSFCSKEFSLDSGQIGSYGSLYAEEHCVGPTFRGYARISQTVHDLWYNLIEDQLLHTFAADDFKQVLCMIHDVVQMYLGCIPLSKQKVAAQIFSTSDSDREPSAPSSASPDPLNLIFGSSGSSLKALYGSVASMVRPLSSPYTPVSSQNSVSTFAGKAGQAQLVFKHILPFIPDPASMSDSLGAKRELIDLFKFETVLSEHLDRYESYALDYLVVLQNDTYWLADQLSFFQAEYLPKILKLETDDMQHLISESIFKLRGRALNLAVACKQKYSNVI